MGLRYLWGQALVCSCSAVLLSTIGCSSSGDVIGGTGGAFTTGGASGGTKAATGGRASSATSSGDSGGAQQGGSSASATGTRSSGGSKSGTGGTRNGETSATGGAAQNSGGATSSAGGTSSASGGSNVGGRTLVATGGSSTAAGAGSGGRTVSTGGAGLGGNSDGTAGHSAALGGNGGSAGGSSLAATGGTTTSSSASSAAAIVPDPSWTCGMPNGIPVPSLGELALTVTLDIDKKYDVGATQFGNRKLYTVKGGKLEGQAQASVLTGGMELELTLSTGSIELEEINVLKASDGTLIYMRTCGVAPAGDQEVRIVPDFEVATSSKLASLNTGKYAGTRSIDVAGGKIVLKIYDISKLTVAEPKVQIKDPASVTNQSWECSTATGSRGSTLFTESVTLGSSLSVGTSKNGNRNIIPITGGTVAGGTLLSSLSGSVVSAGADYQLIGGSNAKLDARYALASKDGEVIVVRNCGPMGSLVPTFEARADGPYAVLNTNKYVSGDPASASGGVSITFYERK